jgi:putative Ca2+/H+ antiporter (TMEM165/GDT1 family)
VEAFLVSSAVVGLAEIGDKTQILSLMPTEAGLSSAGTWSASSMATSVIDVLVRRRKSTSL